LGKIKKVRRLSVFLIAFFVLTGYTDMKKYKKSKAYAKVFLDIH